MFTCAYPEANCPLEPVIQPSTNKATAFAASTEPRFKCGFVASCNVANRAVSGNVSEGAADAKVGAASSEQLMSKCMVADMCSRGAAVATTQCIYGNLTLGHTADACACCKCRCEHVSMKSQALSLSTAIYFLIHIHQRFA